MLPVSISPVASAHVVSPASPSASSRGRLRGLSYLRNYTHGAQHSHSPSPAAPTVVTPANASVNPSNSVYIPPPTRVPPAPPSSSSSPRHRSTSPLTTTSNAWLPTVSGVNGLSRVATHPSAELSTPSVLATSSTRARAESNPPVRSIDETLSSPVDRSAPPTPGVLQNGQTSPLVHTPSQSAHLSSANPVNPAASIRFVPYVDNRAARESLSFTPVERILRFNEERIRVGRYSDRDAANPAFPVGFKSKVVSRRHCEFWCDNGQWFVRDVKSSSGTFLNHIRLSAPGLESKAYPLYDGDILQLGIDFKGGEEQIFRCVKIRVELNRAWQKALNNFNMSAHRRLRNLAKKNGTPKIKESDACSTHTSECAICLMPVAPCQSLFVAPCSHVWHYKCIRPLIEKEYPTFLCPNCRAIADLDREIEEGELDDLWEVIPDDVLQQADGGDDDNPDPGDKDGSARGRGGPMEVSSLQTAAQQQSPPRRSNRDTYISLDTDPLHDLLSSNDEEEEEEEEEDPTTPPPSGGSGRGRVASWRRHGMGVTDLDFLHTTAAATGSVRNPPRREGSGSSTGGSVGSEGPITPMNDAGPFVLDGSATGSRNSSPAASGSSRGGGRGGRRGGEGGSP